MSDALIASAVKPMTFDDVHVKKGDLCTVLRELPDGMGGMLREVAFTDGVRRYVKKADVEVTP